MHKGMLSFKTVFPINLKIKKIHIEFSHFCFYEYP